MRMGPHIQRFTTIALSSTIAVILVASSARADGLVKESVRQATMRRLSEICLCCLPVEPRALQTGNMPLPP
jgi:hypothetical protein